MGFFLADLKTCSFRSRRGGRWRGGSDDGVGGEVVMAIEVVDVTESGCEACNIHSKLL
ncbi:MAG: hypothetical protein ABOK23_02325 [Candidatus Methanoperedens sp.]|nr:hypothetical protein [Candidatus Methanoperedens sp.]